MAEVTVVRTVTQDSVDSSISTVSQQLDLKAPLSLPIKTKTSTYTIGLDGYSDNGSLIQMNGTSTNNITIPSDGTNGITFPVGAQITIVQTSSLQTTINGSGITLNATPGFKLRTQWSSATLIKRAANTWMVLGDLSV